VLKAHLDELRAASPGLRLLAGDALFARRPFAELIVARRRQYRLAVKDNQPGLLEAATALVVREGARELPGRRWGEAACEVPAERAPRAAQTRPGVRQCARLAFQRLGARSGWPPPLA
jgi:hypothetical protein